MLRVRFGLCDQEDIDGWVENPYWQFFCGGTFFKHRPPPTMQSRPGRGRGKIGGHGAEEMLPE